MTTSTPSASLASPTNPSYYQRHIFFCTNQRTDGRASCGDHHSADAATHCKQAVKAAGLNGPGMVRVNQAGCLDRCAAGPVCVVYPEAVWYSFLDNHDIDEIVESHLKNGVVVERLRTPAHLGK
jgi:(2Fe-2S) ferredoxin